MSYTVPCKCGNNLKVTATQAGTDVPCSCGHVVSVPLLSRLRRMAGQEAFEAGTIDTINRMIRDGELPLGDTCAVSGLPTLDSYDLYVQCEFTWTKGPGKGRFLFAALAVVIAPIWIICLLFGRALFDEQHRVLGRNRGVYTPLRVREEHHQQLRRTRSQTKLQRLLRTVPIYATLLDEYPKARITT